MRPDQIIFFGILAIVAFLLVFTVLAGWRKVTDRRLNWAATILCVITVGMLVVRLVLNYEFVNERHAFILAGLAVVAFGAVTVALVRSQAVQKVGKVIAVLGTISLLTIYIFTIKLYLDDFFDSSVDRQYIGEDYYLYTNRVYDGQLLVCSVGKERMGFIIFRRYLNNSGFEDYGPVDSVRFVSLADDILRFKAWQHGVSVNAAVNLRFDYVGQAREGLTVVSLNSLQGAIDSNGEIVIPIEYTMLGDCYNGLLMARKNGKVGFINPANEIVIPYRFDATGNFLSDSACANLDGENFYIDKRGNRLSDY